MTNVKRYWVNRNNMCPSPDGNVVLVEDFDKSYNAFESEKRIFDRDRKISKEIVDKLISELKTAKKETSSLLNESTWKLTKRIADRILDRLFPGRKDPKAHCAVCDSVRLKLDMIHIGIMAYVCNDNCADEHLRRDAW